MIVHTTLSELKMLNNATLLAATIALLLACSLLCATANAHTDAQKNHCVAGWQQQLKGDNTLHQVRHCIEIHGWDVNSTEGTVSVEGKPAKVTALHRATILYAVGAVRYLMSKGADIESKNIFEMTPLHIAALEGHSVLCEMFVQAGAITTDRDIFGETPLDHSARYARVSLGHLKCAAALDPEEYKVYQYEIK